MAITIMASFNRNGNGVRLFLYLKKGILGVFWGWEFFKPRLNYFSQNKKHENRTKQSQRHDIDKSLSYFRKRRIDLNKGNDESSNGADKGDQNKSKSADQRKKKQLFAHARNSRLFFINLLKIAHNCQKIIIQSKNKNTACNRHFPYIIIHQKNFTGTRRNIKGKMFVKRRKDPKKTGHNHPEHYKNTARRKRIFWNSVSKRGD